MSWAARLREWLAVEEHDGGEYEDFEPGFRVSEEHKNLLKESKGLPVVHAVEVLMGNQLSFVEASRTLYCLDKAGEIRLRDAHPPRSPGGYLVSWYSAWFWAVAVFQALVGLTVYVLPQGAPWVYLRYAAGATYVLYVPGAVFIEALYPKRDELEDLERFALGVGLSLALVPLVGLVLNYTPWGIRLAPIFAGLTTLVLVLSLTAVFRKYTYHVLSLEDP